MSRPFQFELRSLFLLTAWVAVGLTIYRLLGWHALPIDAVLAGLAVWAAGVSRESLRLRAAGLTLAGLGALAFVVWYLPIAVLVWVAFGWCVMIPWFAYRQRLKQRLLLGLMATAAKANAPFGPVLAAYSEETSWWARKALRRVAQRLEQGRSLDQAFAANRGLLSAEQHVTLRVGLATDQLGLALAESAADDAAAQPIQQAIVLQFLYFVGIVAAITVQFGFLSIKIFPAWHRILQEFELLNGWVSRWVVELDVRFAQDDLLYVFLGILFLAAVITIAVVLFRPLRRSRESSLVLRMLALCTARARPIELAVQAVAQAHPRWRVRRRARRLAADLSSGEEWLGAAERARLISSAEADVLRTAATAENLTWALRELATSARRRAAYRQQMRLAWSSPLMIVLLGLVAFGVIALTFLPLVEVIEALSQTP